MEEVKDRSEMGKNPCLRAAGILLLVLLAGVLLWYNHATSQQAMSALVAQVRFEGEYRIEDGAWQTIVPGQHIPATKGDVTLRGNFHMLAPDGEYVGLYTGDLPISLYSNHINLTIYEGENEPYVLDVENPLYGNSACSVYWGAYVLTGESEAPIEIRIHNPHRFGNENAVDELLSEVALWSGIDFEKGIMDRDRTQRNIGLFFLTVALLMLGSALFSTLLHLQSDLLLWQIGAAILSAGVYLLYSGRGVPFWNEKVSINTSIFGISIMAYMLFISSIITDFLQRCKRIGHYTMLVLYGAVGIFLLLPVVSGILFYDVWLAWTVVQSMVNLVLLGCMMADFAALKPLRRLGMLGIAMPLLAFEADIFGTAMGWWAGGLASKYIFFVLFAGALFIVLRVIPEGIYAAAKAKELEVEKNMALAELKESRVAIMLSQIKPHFIYNTLGTIERMCLKDPQKAFELVRNFSLYLRGNFSELDSVTPIRFSEELKHVEYYVNIEKVRFPDMTIRYDVETTDFVLPALSVQPLVENAIKHGLMRLESGGTVVIHAYETEDHFCVEVSDDGAGFDIHAPVDGKKHVGLRNIRSRLKDMVNGELILESTPGVGTKALIRIPKEVNA